MGEEVYKLKDFYRISEKQQERLKKVRANYKKLYEASADCLPMIIIYVPRPDETPWEERLADPLVMLKTQLEEIHFHLQIEDDSLPTVRVDFGTAQVAAAFGCPLHVPENNLPAAAAPALSSSQEIDALIKPSLGAGWYAKLDRWTDIWLKNLPDGVEIQHPDIQGPFNTAHLVRGNDLLLDFYDCPEAVERLLDVITDFMIDLVPHVKRRISGDHRWFLDWNGALWRGVARISNCSTDMISPELYSTFVLPRDARFLKAIGGGRIHYCGGHQKVVEEFFKIPDLYGLDVDARLHDIWEIADKAPEQVTLVFQNYGHPFPQTERLLAGDWPKKRNIVLYTQADSVEEAKDLRRRLKASIPYK